MKKIKPTLIMMTLLTASAIGGVVIAYGQEAYSLAACISFVSLMLNYTLSTRALFIDKK